MKRPALITLFIVIFLIVGCTLVYQKSESGNVLYDRDQSKEVNIVGTNNQSRDFEVQLDVSP